MLLPLINAFAGISQIIYNNSNQSHDSEKQNNLPDNLEDRKQV